MSFTDDYDKLRKKRKQEEEQEKKQSKGNSFTEEYDRLKANRQTGDDDDIAPVVTSYEEYDNSPILQAMYRFRGGREGWMQDEIFRAKREANPDEWYKEDEGLEIFKSGAFSDGYDFGDVTLSILGTAGDAALEAAKGFGKVGEGLGKGIALGAAQVGDWFGADDWAEGVRDRAQKNFIDDWTEGIDKGIEKYSFLGDTTDAILQGVGQVGAVAATGGAAGAGVGTATLFGSSFGNSTSEALQNGASDEEAYTYGLMSASVETISEMIFGGLGKGVNMLGFSKGLSSIDDMAAKAAGKFFKSDTGKNIVQWAVKSGFEGAEEVIAGLGNAAAKKLTYMSEKDLAELVQDENLFEQFFVGAMTSGVMQSGIIPGTSNGSLIDSNKTGRDFISGLSKNEQSVVDKVFKDELAKAEENGKVTNKQKNEIYNEVLERMEKGYIDTDTIEEVLGDKSAYDSLEKEAKEYDTLYNTADINLSQAQRDRRAELIEKNKANPYETALKTAREQYSENVRSKVQGDRLLESYNEQDRKFQDYQADFSKLKGAKYEDAAKKTIENAIKAGANNTNAVHDIVDFAAKIAGDTGKAYDFQSDEQSKADFIERQTKLIEELEKQANRNDAQNKKLTELKDILEKVKSGTVKVNGNISANGIVLNLGAGKPLNRVVGHEVTHTFEPAKGKESKEYTALKDALYKLAKAKKIDVDQKRAEYELLYEGLDADAEAEMIADMVGDFLFDDTDFAYNLATENRNVFQKIWDEVKHLYKIATAGSKEARELARVQKAFEDAYRASGTKNTTEDSGVKYSITEPFVDLNGNRFENAVLLDTDFFNGTSPRNWGEKLRTMVNDRSSENPFILPVMDENGNTTMLQFASPNDRVKKDGGARHRVLDELSMTADNISKLAVVHIDEIVSVSEESSPYHTDENSHQWLDKNGWLHRNANVINQKNGNIYNLTIDIAKAADGRTILYATNGKIKKVGNAEVNSLKIKGSGQNSNFDDNVAQKNSDVKKQYSVSDKNIKDIHTGYASDEYYYTMSYTQDGKEVAKLDYGVYEGKPNVKMIEVDPEYRRKGIATKLLQELQKKYPDTEIDFGMATPDGTKLLESITYDVTDEAVVADGQKLKDLQAELDDLEAKMGAFDELFDNGTITEAQRAEFEALGDRWDEVYHSINELAPTLRGKKATKTFVKTDAKYSLSDSDGKQLSKGQQEYFKDSKVRDENGNLKVMYHGSPETFTIFDRKKAKASGYYGKGFYFTDSDTHAGQYGNKYEVYLNITNPLQNGTNDITKEQLRKFVEAIAENEDYGIDNYGYGATIDSVTDRVYGKSDFAMLMDINASCVGNMVEAIELFNEVNGTDYNGIIASTETVAFYPNQIKLVDNKAPTSDPDIRFSLSDVNEGFTPIRANEFFGKDFRVQKPVQEDIAPIIEKPAKVMTEAEAVAPYEDNWKDAFDALVEEDAPPHSGKTTKQAAPGTRKALHQGIVDNIKSVFAKKGLDFDKVLKKAKNLSTFATVDNTPQRVMEKALGYKEGQILSDITVNQVAQNETEGIKWLNSFTDRKNGLLAKISKQYNIKPGSKESAAAQMYAEGFYVDEKNNIIQYGDAELAKDFPNTQTQRNIKGLAGDSRIRQIYDDTLAMINESRTRNAYPEIPRLDNYFLHFRAMEDTFSKLGLPFNPNDIRAKDLPTDLNGVTADLKPGQPYFASAMHRTGKRTSFDLLGGLERYLSSAKNQIYHIDDIQTLRALRNYVADTYGQANGLEGLDALSEEEAQDRIAKVYNSHLSTFAKFLNEEANILAGKTALIDRGLEGIIGRRGITFLDTVNKQVGSNMVGFNVSSSLTNFLSVAQTFAKTNKADFVRAFGQTVANKVGSVFGRSDSFTENSPVVIRRKGADRFYRTPYQKVGDAGYVLMSAVDDISTELIARTKYNELTRKGMDSQQAHYETDKWVSRLMGDRSLGQMPQLYNSKMLGLVTKFQLEVRNQLDSQFYDTIQEAKASNEDIQNGLARNAKTAAKVASTFVQLAVVQHLFGKAFESVAGYNPAFDIIEVLIKAFGWDDDEESEDTALDNIEQGFLALLEDLPYTGTFTGGRIPIESALPIEQFVTGKDKYGNDKSRWETIGEVAPYYILPGGYGQVKKTYQGLSMFDEDHPIAGSYTDSGNLRFPVEDTLGNRVQAGIFGQWASENAQDYFDNERSPLNEKQIQEFIDVDLTIQDYWEYREGLNGLKTLAEKADYIDSLDLTDEQKNVLINNIADRKEDIDMSDYGNYGSFEEFDYATKNPEKYDFLTENGVAYDDYKNGSDEFKDAWSWAYENPEKYTLSQAISRDLVAYRKYASELYDIRADKDSNGKTISGSAKEKKIEYINNLDLEYGERIILFKSLYEADDTYNYDIIEYLNGREDISYEEMETILKELGFKVDSKGNITWD